MAEVFATKGLQSWLDEVAAYERAFKQWEGRVDKILRRYRDEPKTGRRTFTESKFNILWSNVQTLAAATFSKIPKPDVSRRFRDQDPVGRVGAHILERALEYHVQHYPEYRTSVKANVYDRFLGGRGTAWVRYEPHFRALPGQPTDGDQVTEDVDTPDEQLDYECVAVDYVHYQDFGHSVARTWEEVGRVWRKVYMTKEALVERFGEKVAKTIPLDADPRQKQPDKAYGSQDSRMCATIYEGWDKGERKAVWFSKSVKDFLDVKDDPLGLEDVFPCPKPLYATLTNDSLVPTPDFVLYQDQANELDLLSDRIDGLVKALKVCGGYDASIPELQRIFTEGENGTLIPVKNWAAFAEKNGLQGALSLVDLRPTAEALRAAYEAFEQVKGQIHEITGISDIIRGQSKASETATAQQLKGQYASLRLKTYQDEVAQYSSDVLSLMAQVMCRKFAPDTLAKIAGVEQMSNEDQALVPQAMAMLVGQERISDPNAEEGPNPVREFRIEVAADSLVHLDEQAEQQARVEFLTATGGYLQNVANAMQGVPPQMAGVLVPLLMDMLKFGVTGYKVGKGIEGAFDSAAEKLKQLAMQPPAPPPPDPAVMKAQMDSQLEGQRQQMEAKQAEMEAMLTREKNQMEAEREQQKIEQERWKAEREESFERWKAELDNYTKFAIAELQAKTTVKTSAMSANAKADPNAETEFNDTGEIAPRESLASVVEAVNKNLAGMIEQGMQNVAQTITNNHGEAMKHGMDMMSVLKAPRKKTILRDENGRATGAIDEVSQ